MVPFRVARLQGSKRWVVYGKLGNEGTFLGRFTSSALPLEKKTHPNPSPLHHCQTPGLKVDDGARDGNALYFLFLLYDIRSLSGQLNHNFSGLDPQLRNEEYHSVKFKFRVPKCKTQPRPRLAARMRL